MQPFHHMIQRLFPLACAGLLAAAAGSAHALSVDCNKIANPDENTICSEVSLAKLDNELTNNYKLVNANLPMRMQAYLKTSQAAWWASPESPRSGACKGDMACIKAKYVARAAYMGNPNFRYEGVYAGKSARLSLQSLAGGAIRVSFLGPNPASPIMVFDESNGLKITGGIMPLPAPAENCAMQVNFNEAGAAVNLKEAKRKACDSVKTLAGQYARDWGAVPGK